MITDVLEVKSREFFGKIRNWWDKLSNDRYIKVNRKREQYIGILQQRYGYTKDKATSELNKHYSKIRFS